MSSERTTTRRRDGAGRATRVAETAAAGSSDDPETPVKTMVVAGDVTIDWLAQPNLDWRAGAEGLAAGRSGAGEDDGGVNDEGEGQPRNYQLSPGIRMEAVEGGALLLAQQIALACAVAPKIDARVITHRIEQNIRNVPPEKVLHSVVELEECAASLDDDAHGKVLRVARYLGFSGPLDGPPKPPPLEGDDPDADLVVLDDAGNGFRDVKKAWPTALTTDGKTPIVVMKISQPLSSGPLWECVREAHADRLVLVVNADDLRAEGVNLSRRLSWERTAKEFVWQMKYNRDLAPLAALRNLVVRFGVDGAIHYTAEGRDDPGSRLYYDPKMSEDGFRARCKGGMIGLTDAFVAALVRSIAHDGLPAPIDDPGEDPGDDLPPWEGIRNGIRSSRRFLQLGFGHDLGKPEYPGDEVFAPATGSSEAIADIWIPPPTRPDEADADYWRILDESAGHGLDSIARNLVRCGEAAGLQNAPVGEFGKLRTVDRTEIESFRSIRNLMREYLDRTDTKRPLCIAVFGPPGAGKSFGVVQVAKTVAGGHDGEEEVEKLDFNLSQFESTRDLVAAFHEVRDVALERKTPLVFFDEFDAGFAGGSLGWLKFFLAPMQDGEFKDGEAIHPIGKAIFVFAGGTSHSFARFAREEFERGTSEDAQRLARKRFEAAKGPDFVSRLRGFVDILGPNRDPKRPDDRFHVIRRATILRGLFGGKEYERLFDPQDKTILQIDEGVLRALLGVERYKHGIRSMEAVLDMSLLHARKQFEPAALPAGEQLGQHVPERDFSRLVLEGVLFEAASISTQEVVAASHETIAEAIHEKYRRDRRGKKPANDPVMVKWSELGETYRRANLTQADHIPEKMELIGCGVRKPESGQPTRIEFSRQEIELLAELEHERWNAERLDDGWTWGPEKDDEKKTNPWIIPWEVLPDAIRQYDRDTVAGIPEYLSDIGFEIYRVKIAQDVEGAGGT